MNPRLPVTADPDVVVPLRSNNLPNYFADVSRALGGYHDAATLVDAKKTELRRGIVSLARALVSINAAGLNMPDDEVTAKLKQAIAGHKLLTKNEASAARWMARNGRPADPDLTWQEVIDAPWNAIEAAFLSNKTFTKVWTFDGVQRAWKRWVKQELARSLDPDMSPAMRRVCGPEALVEYYGPSVGGEDVMRGWLAGIRAAADPEAAEAARREKLAREAVLRLLKRGALTDLPIVQQEMAELEASRATED